jgi:hypothetical protein
MSDDGAFAHAASEAAPAQIKRALTCSIHMEAWEVDHP